MSFEANPNLDAELVEELRPQLREVAEEVAANCQGNIIFPGGRSGPVEVSDTDKGFSVGMMGPFAHLEEWGSINNGANAPLRRAVQQAGLDMDEI